MTVKSMQIVLVDNKPTFRPTSTNSISPVSEASSHFVTQKGLTFQAILTIALVVGFFSLGGAVCFFYHRKVSRDSGNEARVNPGDPLGQNSLDNYAELLKVAAKGRHRRYLVDDDDGDENDPVDEGNHRRFSNPSDNHTPKLSSPQKPKSISPRLTVTGRNVNSRSHAQSDQNDNAGIELHEVFQDKPSQGSFEYDMGDVRGHQVNINILKSSLDAQEENEPVHLVTNTAKKHHKK